MIRSEALAVWRKVCAYQPTQPRDDLSGDVWAEALAPYDVRDAIDAVAALGAAPRQPGVPWLIEPRDVATECRTLQARRLDARRHLLPDPPATVADDPGAYQAWWAQQCREASSRDWAPPPALEAPRRPAIAGRLARAWSADQ